MAVAPKGIDVRAALSARIVFRASLKDAGGAKLITGITNLSIYELQDDGTLKTYDFADNTFKTGAITTEQQLLTVRKGNNNTTDLGVWTFALTTVTGFTIGGIYFAVVSNSGASPVQQEREFQFGGQESDLPTSATGYPQVDVVKMTNGTTPLNNFNTVFGATDFASNYNTSLKMWNVNTGFLNGSDLAGNNAIFKLKQFEVINSNGTAIVAQSTGGNGNGMALTNNGTGFGLVISGAGSTGLVVTGTTGGQFIGAGGSPALRLTGGATGPGLLVNGGATSGHAISLSATNGDGIFCQITTGIGISTDIIRDATAQGAAAGSIQLDAGASLVNNIYRWCVIRTISGTGAGQSRLCTAYDGGTKQATVVPNWTVVPDVTTRFQVKFNDGAVDIATIRTSTPNALIGGRFDSDVGNIQAAVLTAIASAVELAIFNDGDATALLAAIAAKVETFLINEGDASATLAAIAEAVRVNLTAELARILLALPASGPGSGPGLPTMNDIENIIQAANEDNVAMTLAGIITDHGAGSYERNTEPNNAGIAQCASVLVDMFQPMLEVDGPIFRYTAASLINAPGVDAVAIDAELSANHGAGSWESSGAIGPGGSQTTFTITVNGIALPDADVWITTDEAGTNVIAGTLQTNSEGKVTFLLDSGLTYYMFMQKDGTNPIIAYEFVAD